ncbi:uncharacterized protein KGF55_000513 [Candida pseudojiufengensis]|uniref:uncharacterized protein n=1 Tax=Candida pseudojiufengensis TaxID=497109 RepID=UPI002224122A|nr:uncharacterized protein KGF55_000513 [Candida pseudojiufengensis]KAI5966204.1 hypothetical protein KGF55_000513 [Candida pseudojiufengensis]
MSIYLDIIDQVDSFKNASSYYRLLDHKGKTELGYITPEIANLFKSESEFSIKHKYIKISSKYDTFEKRNELFAEIANRWRKKPELDELLNKGWRDELYIIYNPSTKPYMLIERAFSVLLGVVTYGVHINGYIPAELSSNGKIKMWIPKRSMTKPTYPGMLDNTVAGGLGYPYGLETTVIKECFEEAGLEEDFVKKNIKNVGVVSYMYLTSDKRVQPEVEYIYDLKFEEKDSNLIKPQDGEAEDYQLLEIDEIINNLKNKKFKPNCGLIIIDFLIRHGIINAENESNYLEIVNRCHVKLPFPTR